MALPDDVSTFTLTFGPYTGPSGTVALVGLKGKLRPVSAETIRAAAANPIVLEALILSSLASA